MGHQALTFEDIIAQLTPDIYQELKQVVASGKWLDGRKLTLAQKELSLQAIIAYEACYVAQTSHTGVIQIDKNNACSSKLDEQSMDDKKSSTFARFKSE
ncbi:MAG TPA: DUF1315 family protein [Pseudomonadales bacterium]